LSLMMRRSPAFRFSLALAFLLLSSYPAVAASARNLWKGNDLLGAVEVREKGTIHLVALSDVAALTGLPFREDKESLFLSGAKGEMEFVKHAAVARLNAQIIPLASSVEPESGLWWIEAASVARLLNLLEGVSPARGFRWAGEGVAPSRPPLDSVSADIPVASSEPPQEEPSSAMSDIDRRLEQMADVLKREETDCPVSPPATNASAKGVTGLRWGDQGEAFRAVFDLDGAQEPKVFLKPGKTTVIFRGGAPRDLDRRCPASELALAVINQGDSVSFAFDHPACEVKHFFLPEPPRYVVDFLLGASESSGTPSASSPAPVPAREEPRPGAKGKPLVVLDPGHGGKDPGAAAFGLREKDLNLQIAFKMEKELQRLGADVRLTRRDDRYLKLSERTELANAWGADVFVSIHINALPAGRHATGVEIYFMALPTDKDAMQLALIENRELDGNGSGGADKRTNLLLKILGDMQQNAKISESTGLAEAMFHRGRQGRLPMRRVAQAPFYVLRGAAMPAVLLEMGFLTERSEARLLADPNYQQRLVTSMAPGILDYISKGP